MFGMPPRQISRSQHALVCRAVTTGYAPLSSYGDKTNVTRSND